MTPLPPILPLTLPGSSYPFTISKLATRRGGSVVPHQTGLSHSTGRETEAQIAEDPTARKQQPGSVPIPKTTGPSEASRREVGLAGAAQEARLFSI